MTTAARIRELRRARPRSPFVRWSLLAILVLMVGSWILTGADLSDLFQPERMERFETFLHDDLRPAPVRGRPWDGSAVAEWAGALLRERGWHALEATLAISVLAIVLAWLAALTLAPLASRTLAAPAPYLDGGGRPSTVSRWGWRIVVGLVRFFLILVRSLPEYMMAFFLVAMLGEPGWAAVAALAIHNTGILGRLDAEVIENLPTAPLAALRASGATRSQILAAGVLPAAFNRFLLYFFYRWETCVREATILGTLGVVSLGYWIDDARHRGQEDVMVFFVLLGAALILIGDLISAVARSLVRRATG